MGRNRKLGLEYFPMDVDMFQDIKIRKLIKYQSGKAIVVYTYLLCLIYRNGYYIEWDKELPFIIGEQTGFDEAFVQEVINCCLTLGLFDVHVYQAFNVITSKGVQERYQWVCRNARRQKDITEYNLLGQDNSDANMPPVLKPDEQAYKQEMLDSPIWMEQMSMRHHLEKTQLLKMIDEFFLDCSCRDKTHESLQDAKRHMNDWLLKKATINQAQTKKVYGQISRTSKKVDKPEDFKGSF